MAGFDCCGICFGGYCNIAACVVVEYLWVLRFGWGILVLLGGWYMVISGLRFL